MDALEDGPAGVLVGDPEAVHKARLAVQRGLSPCASCHCVSPAGNPGAVVGCELAERRGKPCRLVSAAMLMVCGVAVASIQAGRGSAGAFHLVVGACHSRPPRPRHQDHR